ncbi:MalM family protein [Salinicola sp. LHM]|uniref:MalM family protein n=1 Tax=Salinicola sp. LHM TaxID=3065298 RepID=UPI002ACE4106|nr:MalM family protein [Salinicola sp. LHM]MEC8918312.1 MalM family protein [Pseudomonadota bacterium]MED5500376.1 MalM family protein [Pseudomonadota bacterium]WQH33207.1 MalM family protein [Salinicola sp. LHM]
MSQRPLAILLSGLALTSLAGCASLGSSDTPVAPAKQSQQALDQATDCCDSLAALPYQPLEVGKSQPLALDTQAPMHRFEDGTSYFQAFELPRTREPLTFELTSTIANDQVFAPTVLVLDDDFQPTQRVTSDKFDYLSPNGFAGARLGATFDITPGPDAAYLVIYSNDTARQDTTQYESAEKVYARVRGFELPPGPDPVAEHTATGNVMLESEARDAAGGLLTPILGTRSRSDNAPTDIRTASSSDRQASTATPADAADFDYRRMIDAALKAGDVELALDLAERAERSGHPGTRAWLAERLQTKTP